MPTQKPRADQHSRRQARLHRCALLRAAQGRARHSRRPLFDGLSPALQKLVGLGNALEGRRGAATASLATGRLAAQRQHSRLRQL